MPMTQTRRRFLTTLSLAGAASVIRAPVVLAVEGPPETTTVRLTKVPGICLAPQYVAEELLRAEGFTEILYVDAPPGVLPLGKADFTQAYASNFLRQIDAGDPITLLSGVHVGCFELFANEGIHGIPDLKGKSVGVQAIGSLGNTLVLMMAAQVGLDPGKDIHWVADPAVKPIELFIQGKIDAFLAFPPEPQDLRARHIGRVILNSASDRPWSQYSAACWAAIGDMCANIRSQPSVCSAPFSRQPISASATRRVPREASSTAVLRRGTTLPCRA
jgi:NitT/TauT family transport system substrate-binding protein